MIRRKIGYTIKKGLQRRREMIKNQEYRDSVFRTIFNNKQRALELYNILYETDYDNPEMVKLSLL